MTMTNKSVHGALGILLSLALAAAAASLWTRTLAASRSATSFSAARVCSMQSAQPGRGRPFKAGDLNELNTNFGGGLADTHRQGTHNEPAGQPRGAGREAKAARTQT